MADLQIFVNVPSEVRDQLDRMEEELGYIGRLLRTVIRKEDVLMALDQEVLDAIAAETSAVDSVIAAINSGAIGGNLNATDKAQLIAGLQRNKTELDRVLPANVVPPVV